MKKLALMLAGLPGSGKTTFRRDLIASEILTGRITQVSSDDAIEMAAKLSGKTYNEVFHAHINDAGKFAKNMARVAQEERTHVIWDQTNLTVKSRLRFLGKFPPEDYIRVALLFNLDETVRLAQDALRPPGRRVPAAVIERMRKDFEPIDHNVEPFDAVFTNARMFKEWLIQTIQQGALTVYSD